MANRYRGRREPPVSKWGAVAGAIGKGLGEIGQLTQREELERVRQQNLDQARAERMQMRSEDKATAKSNRAEDQKISKDRWDTTQETAKTARQDKLNQSDEKLWLDHDAKAARLQGKMDKIRREIDEEGDESGTLLKEWKGLQSSRDDSLHVIRKIEAASDYVRGRHLREIPDAAKTGLVEPVPGSTKKPKEEKPVDGDKKTGIAEPVVSDFDILKESGIKVEKTLIEKGTDFVKQTASDLYEGIPKAQKWEGMRKYLGEQAKQGKAIPRNWLDKLMSDDRENLVKAGFPQKYLDAWDKINKK